MIYYRCWFRTLGGGFKYVDSNESIPKHSGIQAFTSGFWIEQIETDVGLINKLSVLNGDVYIPPSAIIRIEKLNNG